MEKTAYMEMQEALAEVLQYCEENPDESARSVLVNKGAYLRRVLAKSKEQKGEAL